jgi:ATP synthase protein I
VALRAQRSGAGLGKAFELGIQIGACVVVGVALGYYVDRWLETEPVFLLVFMLLGFAAAIRTLLRFAQQAAPPEGSAPGDAPEGEAGEPREFDE